MVGVIWLWHVYYTMSTYDGAQISNLLQGGVIKPAWMYTVIGLLASIDVSPHEDVNKVGRQIQVSDMRVEAR